MQRCAVKYAGSGQLVSFQESRQLSRALDALALEMLSPQPLSADPGWRELACQSERLGMPVPTPCPTL